MSFWPSPSPGPEAGAQGRDLERMHEQEDIRRCWTSLPAVPCYAQQPLSATLYATVEAMLLRLSHYCSTAPCIALGRRTVETFSAAITSTIEAHPHACACLRRIGEAFAASTLSGLLLWRIRM